MVLSRYYYLVLTAAMFIGFSGLFPATGKGYDVGSRVIVAGSEIANLAQTSEKRRFDQRITVEKTQLKSLLYSSVYAPWPFHKQCRGGLSVASSHFRSRHNDGDGHRSLLLAGAVSFYWHMPLWRHSLILLGGGDTSRKPTGARAVFWTVHANAPRMRN